MQDKRCQDPNNISAKATYFLVCLALCFFCCHLLLALLSFRGLIWDGQSFLFNILHERSFFLFDSLADHRRNFALAVLEFPTLLLLWTGVSNKFILMWIFSATLLLHPIISICLCWRILAKTKHLPYLLFLLIGFISYGIVNSLFAVYEPLVLISISWPILFFIMFKEKPTSLELGLLVCGFAIAFRGGEIAIFILPVLILALINRIQSKQDSFWLKRLWLGLIFYCCLLIFLYLQHLCLLPASTREHLSTTMLRPQLGLLTSPLMALSLVTCLGSMILIAVQNSVFKKYIKYVSGLVALMMLIFGLSLLFSYIYFPYDAYVIRGFYGILIAGLQLFALIFMYCEDKYRLKLPIYPIVLLLSLGLIFQSLMQMKTTYHSDRYLTLMESEVATKSGYVPYEKTALNAPNLRPIMEKINLFWCSNTLSVLLNGSNAIHTIIGNRDPAFNKKLNPLKPETFKIVALARTTSSIFTTIISSKFFDYRPFFENVSYKSSLGKGNIAISKPLPDAAFKSEVICQKETVHFFPWRRHNTLQLQVINHSSEWWPNSSHLQRRKFQILIRPHLYDNSLRLLDWDLQTGETALPYPLGPSRQAAIEVNLDGSLFPHGQSILEFDLVQETVAWFSGKGGKTCKVKIKKWY